MKNTITRDQIDALLAASEIDVCTKFDKVTVVTCKLPNGFVLVEASGAVSKENYSEEMGRKVCLDRIATKLWQLEGYQLSTRLAHAQEAADNIRAIPHYVMPADVLAVADEARQVIALIEEIPGHPTQTTAVLAACGLRDRITALHPAA